MYDRIFSLRKIVLLVLIKEKLVKKMKRTESCFGNACHGIVTLSDKELQNDKKLGRQVHQNGMREKKHKMEPEMC